MIMPAWRRVAPRFRFCSIWGLRRRSRLRAALAPAAGLRMPVGGLFLMGQARRWRLMTGFPVLEVGYVHAGDLVAELVVVDKSSRRCRELVVDHVEVVPVWRGRGVCGFLMDLLAGVSAQDWDLMSGTCDADGRAQGPGWFEWDVRGDHLLANMSAVAAILTGDTWAMSEVDASDVGKFLDQLNLVSGLSPGGWSVRPDRCGTQFHHSRIDVNYAALIVLDSVGPAQLFAMAQEAGPAALRLLRHGSDWHGVRELTARP